LKAGKHSIFWGDVAFNANHSVAYRRCPAFTQVAQQPGRRGQGTVLPLTRSARKLQLADNLASRGVLLDWKRPPAEAHYYGARTPVLRAGSFFLNPAAAPTVEVRRTGASSRKAAATGHQPEVVARLSTAPRVYYRKFRRAPALVGAAVVPPSATGAGSTAGLCQGHRGVWHRPQQEHRGYSVAAEV